MLLGSLLCLRSDRFVGIIAYPEKSILHEVDVTVLSVDNDLTPREAYHFASKERVGIGTNRRIRVIGQGEGQG